MKRTRATVETEVATLAEKRARLLTEAEAVLREIESARVELHGMKKDSYIRVPWAAFEGAASLSRDAWAEIDVEDVYEQHNDCANVDTCWYRGNMDRLAGLTLYRITCGNYVATVCDQCFEERHRYLEGEIDRALLGGATRRSRDYGRALAGLTIAVDPSDFEPALATYLRSAADGADLDELELPHLLQ